MAEMLPEQWQKLEEIFQTAADLPPDSQTIYLDDACRGDADLRREVEAMLAASPLGLIESAIAGTADDLAGQPEHDPLVGSWLGPYRIDGVLGRGGMGAVYRAFREDDQFHKQVAIKVIPRMLAGPEMVARFRSERQILAHLEHSNIARLFDGGTAEGIPYLVMEYVEGVPITQYVREKALSIPDRLRLMQSVCSAVSYAHHNLVIHRDLKPANIMVTSDGVVKLLDFGVAKLVDPSADPALTAEMMMTPDYASPEQIRGEPVTTASDVYALGVVLYEVLTGERPYRITSSNLHDLERLVCKTEPRKPSTLEALPSRMRRRLAGDLDNIVLMALRKDVMRRYASAEQLSEDIRRHLQGMPIHARRDTLFYRSGKFLARHQWSVMAALLVAASLVTGTVIAIRQARAAQARFDQLRGFARTVLVDLHGQLSDIPGTAKARQTLIAYVDDYLQRVAAAHAGDDTALATELATTYLRLGEVQGTTPEAIASFEKGRLLLEQKWKRRKPDPADVLVLARLRVTAGSTLMDLDRAPEAVENLQAAERLASGLGPTVGWNAEARLLTAWADWRLGRLYRIEYRLQEAADYSRRAVTVCEDLYQHGIRTKEMYDIFEGARLVLAGVLRRQGKWDDSLVLYQKVLDDTEGRAKEDPSSANLQRALARAHQIMGDMVIHMPGRRQEVLVHVREAIRIAEKLSNSDPWDKTAKSELAQYLSSGGEDLVDPRQWDESMLYLHRCLPMFEELLKGEPNSGVFQIYYALTEADIGQRLADRNRIAESLVWLRKADAHVSNLVERDPRNTTHFLELLKVQRLLVNSLARAGRAEESLALAADTIRKAQGVSSPNGKRQEISRSGADLELPRAYASMGSACRILGKREESRKWYRMAVAEWNALEASGFSASPDTADEVEEARKGAEMNQR